MQKPFRAIRESPLQTDCSSHIYNRNAVPTLCTLHSALCTLRSVLQTLICQTKFLYAFLFKSKLPFRYSIFGNTFIETIFGSVFVQFTRVEICGVNTAKLKVLKEAEKMALLKKIRETGDERARNELIEGNLRLVLSVIQRFSNRGENPDDLFQVGCIGLIKAIDNFDVTQNVRFSTYAVPMIIGEIRRYLRDYNTIRVSRSLRDTAYHAMQIKERIQNDLGRDATIEEIAQEMEIEPVDVVLALEAIVEPLSLY